MAQLSVTGCGKLSRSHGSNSEHLYVAISQKTKQSNFTADSASILYSFCSPIDAEYFKRSIYRRGDSLAVLGGGLGCFKHLLREYLHDADIAALAAATPSEQIHCWLKPPRPAASPSPLVLTGDRIDSVKVSTAKDAMVCYAAGASLYFRAPQDMADAFVPALSDALGMGFAGYYDAATRTEPRGEVEVFASRAGHCTSEYRIMHESY
jgi:hypothetical protein